jgi:regulator of sigma E protease
MDVVIFILALSVLVLVHEFGHFFAAKITGVKVEEFGLGLPPRIVAKKWRGTEWSLNWLPIGGFCKLYGEDGDGKGKDAFNNKNPWAKGLIVLGGVLMNLVLAVVVFTVVYAVAGVPVVTDRVKILEVSGNSPAEKAGLRIGDWVESINGVKITTADQLTAEVGKYRGKEAKLEINRGGQTQDLSVLVRENPPEGEGSMGIAISNTEMEKIKWYQFYKGVAAGFQEAYFWGKIIAVGVWQMVSGLAMGHVPKDISGPLGIYEATSSIKKSEGMLAVVHFFGIVSVNLAIVNVLPFPALDGGRIIFVVYEMLTKKKANQQFEALVNNLGMAILLSLIVVITVGDVIRLIK